MSISNKCDVKSIASTYINMIKIKSEHINMSYAVAISSWIIIYCIISKSKRDMKIIRNQKWYIFNIEKQQS